MSIKLTLEIEKSVINKAKIYAKVKQKSLSELIETYLKELISEESFSSEKPSFGINKLRGSFKAPKGFNYKKELIGKLTEKYID